MSDPADLGVLEASALLRRRELSAVELTAACLARIEARNGGAPTFDGAPEAINAWVRVYPELARESARAADAGRAGGDAPPLCGIPLALKDLYGMRGLPLTASSRVLEGNVADRDAEVWARLREQGMVLLGHTHTHEFAAGGTTDQVGNPWALDRVVGRIERRQRRGGGGPHDPRRTGRDTCGSLRIPSACCGTSAIKPTHGRCRCDGIIPLAPTPRPSRADGAHDHRLRRAADGDGGRRVAVNPTVPAAGAARRAAAAAHGGLGAAGGIDRRYDRPHRPDAHGSPGGERPGRGAARLRAARGPRGGGPGSVAP